MPTSDPSCMTEVCKTIIKLRPKTALDLGSGFGKYGVLLREYMDVWFGRPFPRTWEARIDAVELWRPYITPLYEAVYDNIFVEDIRDFVSKPPEGALPVYDLCYFGDVIEHFPKEEGLDILRRIPAKHVLLQTPNFDTNPNRPALYGNEAELHLSRFYASDFEGKPGATIICQNRLLLVLIDKGVWR